jgi:hypothetical protein
MMRVFVGLLAVLQSVVALAAEPRDAIKTHKYEIRPTPYRDEGRRDPFSPMVPLRAVRQRDEWKVRIASLELSSVIMGKKKVAIFNEVHGPRFSYILVNGVLIGPDHRPIPGIAGTIEPVGNRGEYRVVLKQGAERVEYAMANWNLSGRKNARSDRKSRAAGSARETGGNPSGGGS